MLVELKLRNHTSIANLNMREDDQISESRCLSNQQRRRKKEEKETKKATAAHTKSVWLPHICTWKSFHRKISKSVFHIFQSHHTPHQAV